jgi:hypothetical protein
MLITPFGARPAVRPCLRGCARASPEVLPDTPPRTLACPAGDVLFLDRFLPHRTLPNQTTTIRWSLVMWLKGHLR